MSHASASGPRWLKVSSPRNSECGSASLAELDWTDWWEDSTGWMWGCTYIHVASRDGETKHRVFCRHEKARGIRLAMRAGVLYWLVDR